MNSQVAFVGFVSAPFLALALNLKLRLNPVSIFLCSLVFGYFALVASVWMLDLEIQKELYLHDTNGDGTFSSEEMTPEAKEAMERVVSDTGRQFAPFTGIPITFIWTGIVFGTFHLLKLIYKKYHRTIKDSSNSRFA
ncbi:hypothetical protein MLD52_23105 [Puniceicoccaceae bacterium K14]|nr:hypothetical protein [Puniceicoccaceae bacterium K14]